MKKAVRMVAEMMHEADPSAQFAVELWDGESIGFGDPPRFVLRFKSEETTKDILNRGFLGFGEAYTAGEVEVDGELQELMRLGLAIDFDGTDMPFRQKIRLLPAYLKAKNTIKRAPQQIAHHYDRGNDFYALYLDPTMTYSCAYFRNGQDSLEQAQLNKYEHICRKLMLQPGETLVDVGCGWGGMLIYAAQKYGVKGVGITLSENQYDYVGRKIKELGLERQLEVRFEDYRNLHDTFDKFVSIGMFEHVGKDYIPLFMEKVARLVKPGGLGLLHTIGKDTESPSDAWIMQYIFPGGYIPNLSEVTQSMGKYGFSILDVENLRLHYAHTLDRWAENFERNIDQVRELFDKNFERMWRLYLNSCAAGFKYGEIRLHQFLFSNGLNNDLPITREHVYEPY